MLRLIYAIVFLGLAAATLTGTSPEWLHLWHALTHPYHSGEPPRAVALLGAALVLVSAAVVLVLLLRRRTVPLWISAGVLLGTVLALIGSRGEAPEGRSWAAADKEILGVGSKLHRQMIDRLQSTGAVPAAVETWRAELDKVHPEPSPARTRGFARLDYRLERVAEKDERPKALIPGTFVLWVAPQGEAFQLHPVGFDEGGEVALLKDSEGRPVLLSGAFNPDMREPARSPVTLPPVTRPNVLPR